MAHFNNYNTIVTGILNMFYIWAGKFCGFVFGTKYIRGVKTPRIVPRRFNLTTLFSFTQMLCLSHIEANLLIQLELLLQTRSALLSLCVWCNLGGTQHLDAFSIATANWKFRAGVISHMMRNRRQSGTDSSCVCGKTEPVWIASWKVEVLKGLLFI